MVGHNRSISEAPIGTKEGMVKAWTVRRRVGAERWNAAMVFGMKGSPQRMSEEEPGEERPVEVAVEMPDNDEPEELPKTRAGERKSIYIWKRIILRNSATRKIAKDAEKCR